MFEKAKSLKVPDAIRYADNETARVLGDRRIAMSPQVYNSFWGKVFAPFTLEQTAQMTSFIQNIGAKKWGTVLGTLMAWHAGNEVMKNVTGNEPFFDPVDAVLNSSELWQGSDQKEKSQLKAVTNLLAESLILIPAAQSPVYTLYALGDQANVLPSSTKVFDNDPTWMNTGSLLNPFSNVGRKITGNPLIDEPLNIASKTVVGANTATNALQTIIS